MSESTSNLLESLARQFGVSFLILVAIGWGVRACWAFLKPFVAAWFVKQSEWFNKQIETMEAVNSALANQVIADNRNLDAVRLLSQSQFGRHHAHEIAVHSIDVLESMLDSGEKDSVKEPLGKLKEAVERIKRPDNVGSEV